MEEQENIIVMQDEEGNELKLEIIDSFLYDGNEYAVLAEPCGCEEDSCDCGHEHGEDCDCEAVDVYIMQVHPRDDENDEFIPVPEEIEEEVLAYAGRYLDGEFDEEE